MARDADVGVAPTTSRPVDEEAGLLSGDAGRERRRARSWFWRHLNAWSDLCTHPIVVCVVVLLVVCGLVYVEEARSKAGDDGSFVRVAHEVWLGSEMPGVKRLIFERNRKVLEASGWRMKLWTEGDIGAANFPLTHATLERGRAFREITGEPVYSMLVDLMKYEVLLRYGGLYLDTNVELFKDVAPLFHQALRENKEVFMVSDPGDSRFLSAGMFGAPAPGARVFETLLNSTGWLENVDFSKRCVANAITGPVWLSHVITTNGLEDTVMRLDRDVAYPLGCGENEYDTCVRHVEAPPKKDAEARAAMEHTAVNWRSLNGEEQSFSTYLWRKYKRLTTGSDYWNPTKSESVLVKEADESFWNISIPCSPIADENPRAYAMDHFSFHGASWQDGCAAKDRQNMVVEWLEGNVPSNEELVHQWAMSFIRMLSPAPAPALITRIRLHQSKGTYKKARLIVSMSSLRGGASLLGEALATASNHPLDSTLWERDGAMRSDAYFANYISLGDWWSVNTLPKADDGSWRWKLRTYLLAIGVKEATIDASLNYPAEFLNEVQSRAWDAGIDKVYVVMIGASLYHDEALFKRSSVTLNRILKMDKVDASDAPVLLCLQRANKLDMYASQARAAAGTAPLQQIRAYAEPYDAYNITVRNLTELGAREQIKFNRVAFNGFVDRDKKWFDFVRRALKSTGQECAHFKYEEDLATPEQLARTVLQLHDAYQLDLNAEALSLLKLERVNDYIQAADFTNIADLGPNALHFLRRTPQDKPVITELLAPRDK